MRVPMMVTPVVLLFTVVATAACAPLDRVVVPDSRNAVMYGEVRSVDARRGRFQIREERGRTHTVRYDNRTRVVYRSRQYPASALQRGDLVQVRVAWDRSGTAWADRVDVRQSAQDRRVATVRVQRLDGRVGGVDTRRGYFVLEQSRSRAVVVHVPRRLSSSDARRFERLRRGDRVRVDVRPAGRSEVELVRFR